MKHDNKKENKNDYKKENKKELLAKALARILGRPITPLAFSTAAAVPAVYVGTYKKYNDGSLRGKWMDLDKFDSYADFLKAALELHEDEEDPELMFQDYENFPREFYGESHLDPKLWDWISLDEEDKAILSAWMKSGGKIGEIDEAKDRFLGKYDSKRDWAMEWTEDAGMPKDTSFYLFITETDKRIIAGEEAESLMDSYSDEEICEKVGLSSEYENLTEENSSNEIAEKLGLKKLEELVSKAKDLFLEEEAERIEKELDDPVGYFVDDRGYYTKEELAKEPWISFDYDKFARESETNGDVDFVDYEGDVYVFNRV
jgi:antirestriction protein